MLITESLYNLLYNLPSAPPEMGGLLGQSKNTINTIFVDSGKISFRKSCQYVPNELLLNQTISDWDAQGIIFKGIFHTHKEGHGCQCLSSADIVYRLTSIDDRQLIGSTMSASGIQLEHVAVYRPGEALMSYEGLQRPFELRIQEQKGHGSETPNDDELYDIMLHKPAFFQLAQKEENLKLETLKENVKSLKKKEVEALCALSEYDSSVHTSTQITDFYWHMENIYTSIVILRSQYRRDCQAINELFISAERKAMLDELIRSIGESLQQKIKNNVVFLDSNGQLE